MRRLMLSIAIAAGLLAIPVIYVWMFADVSSCPPGWWCAPSPHVGAVQLFFVPGFILVGVPLRSVILLTGIDPPDAVFFTAAITADIALYGSLVWLVLRRRDRRRKGSFLRREDGREA